MTLEEFGQSIQAKYPQYANKSAVDVGNAMLQKYPQYRSQVQVNPNSAEFAKTQEYKNAFPKEEPASVKQSFMSRVGSALGNTAIGAYKGAANTVSNVESL